jgi:hypothetical protein
MSNPPLIRAITKDPVLSKVGGRGRGWGAAGSAALAHRAVMAGSLRDLHALQHTT